MDTYDVMAVEEGTFYGLPMYSIPGFKFARWHHLEQAVDAPAGMDRDCHIAGGFSRHGFKFCSVVGEILVDLAEHGSTRHDISLFRAARFAKGSLA